MSPELKAHYALGTTTLAKITRLERTDGLVLTVTLDHDMPIIFESETYMPAIGMIPSTIETSNNLSVDNLDARGALTILGIDESDIDAGLWDMCDVRVMEVNWKDLTMGCRKIKRGHFGQISIGRDKFSNEVRGITQRLQQTLGDIVTPACNADLFDTRCGVVATEGIWKHSGVAITTATSTRLFTAASLSQDAGFYNGGKVTWTTGLNAGLSKEIKSHTAGGVFELYEPMPYAVVVSDQATFYAGCQKRADEDCRDKFSNIIRFRGFNRIPGNDQMFKGV